MSKMRSDHVVGLGRNIRIGDNHEQLDSEFLSLKKDHIIMISCEFTMKPHSKIFFFLSQKDDLKHSIRTYFPVLGYTPHVQSPLPPPHPQQQQQIELNI